MTRRFRATAWAVILGLAAFQAYAQRYAISPDGISYLDLSDAVVTGHWSGLVNLYWSPLYPLLIGLARAIAGAGPEREVVIIHAVNVVCFAAMLAAFDYFIIQVLAMARDRRGAALGGRYGPPVAYVLFGCLALTMTPLELTTPDWLSNAAILLAFGALLRLRTSSTGDTRRALILGAALGVGALAKSFLVPWGVLCFVAFAVMLRRRSKRPLVIAASAWLVFVAPWTALLSVQAHRVTFGDAGRLTYAWYVNGIDTPSLGVVPSGARRASTDAVLPGIGVTGDAPGTDPMWFDPARWNAPIRPKLSVHDQLATLETMVVTLIGNVSLLAFAVFLVAVAPRGSRRRSWHDGWVVFIPALGGIAAYCMVIVTSRYIMAFALAALLTLLATLPLPRRMHPLLVLFGITLTIAVEMVPHVSPYGLSFVTAVAAAMYVASMIPLHRRAAWFASVTLAIVVSVLVLSPALPAFMGIGALAVIIALWAGARGAVRRRMPEAYAGRVLAGLAYAVTLIFAGRLALRVARDAGALSAAANAGNPQTRIAQDLATHGVVPGTRVAVIGPHAEAYWARAARVKIVATVPNPLAPVWWILPEQSRERVLAEFASAGAQVAIATRLPENATGASGNWTPLRYHGWMRRLSPAAAP